MHVYVCVSVGACVHMCICVLYGSMCICRCICPVGA